jgi:hypothetical protein
MLRGVVEVANQTQGCPDEACVTDATILAVVGSSGEAKGKLLPASEESSRPLNVLAYESIEYLTAVHFWHAKIQHHAVVVDRFLFQVVHGFGTVAERHDFPRMDGERPLNRFQHETLVVNNNDPRWPGNGSRRNLNLPESNGLD